MGRRERVLVLVPGKKCPDVRRRTGIFQGYFRNLSEIFLSLASTPPPPVSEHFSGTSAGACMMRYGFEFYDGVVTRYAILVSQGVKNERGGHSFGSVAILEKGNNHGKKLCETAPVRS